MTNIYLGPEGIQKVISSMFGVPLKHKFRHQEVKKIVPKKNQRLFFAIPAKRAVDLKNGEKLLKSIPERFFEFGQLYRVVYDQKAYRSLDPNDTEGIYVTGLNIFLYDKDKQKWSRVGHKELAEEKLYKEYTKSGLLTRIYYALSSSHDSSPVT